MKIAVLLMAGNQPSEELMELAESSVMHGIGDVLITDEDEQSEDALAHADAWTMASWIAARIDGVRVAVEYSGSTGDGSDPVVPVAAVLEKAMATLRALASGRVLDAERNLVRTPEQPDESALRRAAESGLPVVPVRTVAEIERLAALISKMTSVGARTDPTRTGATGENIADAVLPEPLRARAVRPGDPEYASVSSTYLRGGAPGLVLRARNAAEVADALAFAREHRNVPFGIRSAGHGISGRSTNLGGLILDVSAMNTIQILDATAGRVRIGPGATWKQIASVLTPHGLALGSGDYGGVGVGGLATAGGIGLLSRKHGLTVDHVHAVELVLADGTQVRASETENPDLFWAVRGAGANFAVATAFEFDASRVGDVGWAQLMFATEDIEASLLAYGRIASAAPRDTTAFFVTGRDRGGRWGIQLYTVVDNPDPDTVIARLTPFLELGDLVRQQVVMTGYDGVMGMAADIGPEGQQGFGNPVSRSAFLNELTPEFAKDAAELLTGDLVYFLELRAMGGAIRDTSVDAMAYSHRKPEFQLVAMSASDDRLTERWTRLRHHFDGLYLSFETDQHPDRLQDAFPGAVLDRLRALKDRYDPSNLFRDNFNIPPTIDTVTREAAGA